MQQHQHQHHQYPKNKQKQGYDSPPSSFTNTATSSQQDDRCLVNCRLRRNTFLPGETVEGAVKFVVSSRDQAHINIEEATVQAHGYVKVDPRWINLPTSIRSLFSQNAGATNPQAGPMARYKGLDDENSACVFASEVAVVLRKERLFQEEPASFSFSVVLPDKLTPTFRGVGIRYAYAITVSIRRAVQPPQVGAGRRLFGLVRRTRPAIAGFSTKDLHVPFTVLSEGPGFSSGLEGFSPPPPPIHEKGGEGVGEWGVVESADLEVERISKERFNAEAERARAGGLVSGTRAVTWNMQGRALDDHPGSIPTLSIADGGGPGRGAWDGVPPPMVYSIRSGENRIGSFILHKADFCAGDVVLGNFDFSGASTRCLQVCACLQVCEENVFSGAATATVPGTVAPTSSSSGRKIACHKRVVDSSKELTPCVTQSSVALSLPMDAPMTFATQLVSVTWLLRFEFVMEQPVVESRWTYRSTAPKTSILRWEVPIRVVPPRRSSLSAGSAGIEQGFNAMDATGRSIVC